jgi:ribonuclease T2
MLQRILAILYYKFGSRLQEMLSSGGIQISNGKEYALSEVIDTIKHAFGGSPQIVCKRGSVEELRLCFDKELKPRDCLTTSLTNGSVSRTKHCPQYIKLPKYDPLVLANSTGEIMTQFDHFEVSAAIYTA